MGITVHLGESIRNKHEVAYLAPDGTPLERKRIGKDTAMVISMLPDDLFICAVMGLIKRMPPSLYV